MWNWVTLSLVLVVACAHAAPQDYRTTPVPILKQINRHNDDGSYSYGYEGADGTFKIETKYPSGEVYGKYGYIGDDGKLREVEYGASKRGFEPAGSGINVAPPTLSNSIDETNTAFDDGQYREDPSVYYNAKSSGSARRLPVANALPTYQASRPQFFQYQQPKLRAQSQTQYQYTTQAQAQPQARYQYIPQSQYFNSQSQFQPVQFTYDPAIFNGHPATNFDINTGSYTISYAG